MAGFRINIDDGRNAPVKPLEPPGGGAVPNVSVAQTSSEASTAQDIADAFTDVAHDGITVEYDPASRKLRLRNTHPIFLPEDGAPGEDGPPGQRGADGASGGGGNLDGGASASVYGGTSPIDGMGA
jgi:hypothetical protein